MSAWDIAYIGITGIIILLQVHYRFILKTLQSDDTKNAEDIRKVDKKLADFCDRDREEYASLKALKERVRLLELEIDKRQEILHNIQGRNQIRSESDSAIPPRDGS